MTEEAIFKALNGESGKNKFKLAIAEILFWEISKSIDMDAFNDEFHEDLMDIISENGYEIDEDEYDESDVSEKILNGADIRSTLLEQIKG